MTKPILLKKNTYIDLEDTTLLCMSLWTLCKRFIVFGTRKPKVSKANGMYALEHASSNCYHYNVCVSFIGLKYTVTLKCSTVYTCIYAHI